MEGRPDPAGSGGHVPLRLLGPGLPWSLTCGLAIVKGHPTSHLGEGCVSLLIKGEFPPWMGNKRQPQRAPLLNWKESDLLSRLGGELRAAVSQQALSHPREDKLSPRDPPQRPEPGQMRGWSHLREKSGRRDPTGGHQATKAVGWLLSALPTSGCTCHTSRPEKGTDTEEELAPCVTCRLSGFKMYTPVPPLDTSAWPDLPF